MIRIFFLIIFSSILSLEVHSLGLGDLTKKLKEVTEEIKKGTGTKTDTNQQLDQQSILNIQSSTAAPQGTEKISKEDIVQVNLDTYSTSPSDTALDQLNFKMSRNEAVKVLKKNGCKILANWKRRVITKGQKDSRKLKSKCFTKKMIVIGFEENGVMEFIADTHFLGSDNKQHFLENYDKNKARVRIESFQRYTPEKIYNIGSRSAICLNEECMEMVYRSTLRKEIAFLYLNPKSTIGKEWAKKSIESFKLALERPGIGCVVNEDNPCLIVKSKYVDPSIKYLNMFLNGPRTPERESLRQMYINYVQAQILAAEALGLTEVVSELKLLLDYIVSDPAEFDAEYMVVRISSGTNELLKNANKGSDNKEAKQKIEEAHIFAAKAGNEGQLFFKSINAIFSAGSFEDAAAAAEIASRTKGNLKYFYKALKEIREAKNVNLTSETKEEFGAAEDAITI